MQGYSATELYIYIYIYIYIARILMNKDIDTNKVCHIQTLGVTKNCTFIVDIDDVLFSNLIADDLGVWKKWNKIGLFLNVYKWISGNC